MNREYKSKLDWKPRSENDSSRQQFKDLFIAMCAQIPHAEDKAACPEQHRLKTSNRLSLPLEELSLLCVRHGPPAAPEPKKLDQLGLKQPRISLVLFIYILMLK